MTHQPDIVERLRMNTEKYPGFQNTKTEAADEIERLREAVRVMAEWTAAKLEGQKNHIRQAKRGSGVLAKWQRRVSALRDKMMSNPLAAAAIREARGGRKERMKKCEKCEGNGWLCAKCGEKDSYCACPFNGGMRPGVKRCGSCNASPAQRDARKAKKGKVKR